MAVGVNGTLGKCMIREGHGINVEVRRSLRDIFRKVPMLSMKIQVNRCFRFGQCLSFLLPRPTLILQHIILFSFCNMHFMSSFCYTESCSTT
jgi:hypothetical protein